MIPLTCTPNPFSGKSEAICRLGGLENLYIKSVKRFQNSYSDSNVVLSGLINQEKYEEAKNFAHSLKGLTATLGMKDLRSCSEAIEIAIKEGRYKDLPPLLQSYDYSLRQVICYKVDHS